MTKTDLEQAMLCSKILFSKNSHYKYFYTIRAFIKFYFWTNFINNIIVRNKNFDLKHNMETIFVLH